jgi:hypothetical protein
MMHRSLAFTILALSSAPFFAAQAAENFTPEQKDFFDKKIKPILTDKCYKCHSNDSGKSKGGLLLDSREAALKGGDTGPAVVPGDVEKSLMLTAVSYKDKDLQMPPKGEKLSDKEIADLTTWIKDGAADTRAAAKGKLSGLTDKARQHWAYQPVVKPAIPAVQNRAWCVTPVDAFILSKLEEKKMLPSPPADKETLLRRASFDLIGMPPTPDEIKDFNSDNSPQAFDKVVQRLLASPHYGERWGRFWLDSARYSDTTGDRQNNRNTDYRFPYAWTYRDYVVRSFNDDKPYDRFIVEQLAADKLTDLKDQRDLAALGFLTVGKRGNNVNDIIDDRIDTVSKGFLAMTVACARCHDHMFDPIPTKDYYALHGVFSSIDEPKDKPVISQAGKEAAASFNVKMEGLEQANRDNYYKVGSEHNAMLRKDAATYLKYWYLARRPGATEDEQKKGADLLAAAKLDREVTRGLPRMVREEAVFGPLRSFQKGSMGNVNWDRINPIVAAAFKGTTPKNIDEVVAIYAKVFAGIAAKAADYEKALAASKDSTGALAGFEPAEIQVINVPLPLSPASVLTTDGLVKEIDGWPLGLRNRGWKFASITAPLLTDAGADARAMVVEDKANPVNSPVFIRGLSENRGDIVPRHFLEILSGGKPSPFKHGSGRLELAQAIASKNNPLTARVIVNRVWLHHFGEGFIRTPDDLGTMSEKPTHPELLDYLSSYLMEQGWSLKKLHRLIMLSKVYQETSHLTSETTKGYEIIDPENRLLWRANLRRLDFEAMRDSLLVMANKLDPAVGGQPVNLTDEPYSHRRTIYGYIDRGNLPELMSHFDFSNPEQPNSRRTTTIVPQQALFLMNSPFVIDATRNIWSELMASGTRSPRDLIIGIYKRVLGRTPTGEETAIAYQFLQVEAAKDSVVQAEARDMNEKATKKAAERAKKGEDMENMSRYGAIQNEGKTIERSALTGWQTFIHALLLSNEAAYVN